MPGTIDAAIPDWIELAAVLVSALSGAILAAKGHGFDVGGVAALALVAGLGGGLIRDVLLGQGAPAALRDERYLMTVVAATGLGFFFASTLNRFQGLLLVLDAAALGLFSVVGADKADQAGLPAVSAVLLGTITGVGGGILRDLLSSTTPVVFQRDIYAMLATFGSVLYLTLRQTELHATAVALFSIGAIFVSRLVVVRFHLDGPRPRDLPVSFRQRWPHVAEAHRRRRRPWRPR